MKTIRKQGTFRKKSLLFFILVFFGLVFAFSFGMAEVSATSGDKIYVNTHGNDKWNGLSPKHTSGVNGPKATIKNATGTVNQHGTVYIANGVYSENKIHISKDMNIMGTNKLFTIVNGKNSGRIFLISPNIQVTIRNLKLTRGNAGAENGGAIFNNGTLFVNNCKFTNNTAFSGGAIFTNHTGVLNVNTCEFTKNIATVGLSNIIDGGSAIWNGNTCSIRYSTFTDNDASASDSAAIFNLGLMNIKHTIFTKNKGGAIVNYRYLTSVGNLKVTNTQFTSNIVKFDGGAIFSLGNVNVHSCLFNGNIAREQGGAIWSIGNLIVKSSTFKFNLAIHQGGAIYVEPEFTNSTININFNRIVRNTASAGNGIYYNEFITDSIILNATRNWWGLNSSPAGQIHGPVLFDPWLLLTADAHPKTIDYGGTSSVTANLLQDSNGGYNNPANGHVPNGIPISFKPDWASTVPTAAFTMDGQAKTVFHANGKTLNTPVKVYTNLDSEQNTVYAKINIKKAPTKILVKNILGFHTVQVNLNATLKDVFGNLLSGKILNFHINGHNYTALTNMKGVGKVMYTPNTVGIFPITVDYLGNSNYVNSQGSGTLVVSPTAYLYLKISSSPAKPEVGEPFTVTYKLGNKGPDTAKNVIIYILLPKEFKITKIIGDGTWKISSATGQLIWKLKSVPIIDPHLHITGIAATSGEYIFSSFLTSETFNLNRNILQSFTVNVNSESHFNPVNPEEAGAESNTVPMQVTGVPVVGLVLGLLLVSLGILIPRKGSP